MSPVTQAADGDYNDGRTYGCGRWLRETERVRKGARYWDLALNQTRRVRKGARY